ncbi:MAG: hypothetical protein L0Y71_05940 [Gemmataceae bacterium]|nr:hypothetical protein [Gemmataceae bacterium]
MEPNLLGIVLLGFGGGVIGLLGLFYARVNSSWIKGRAVQCAALAPVVAAGIVALTSDTPELAWLPLGLAAFWLVLIFGETLLAVLHRVVSVLRRPAIAWGSLLVASPLLATVWSFHATSTPEYWAAPSDRAELCDIRKTAIDQDLVRTDAGRVVEVKAPVRAATPDEIAGANAEPTRDAICTDSAGVDYNCHGWVFTGGRFWIGGKQVDGILEDNGYYPVDCPEAGDIIVYRNSRHEVLHTGLVRVADDLGILIESKWGARGRYVHTPENQGYSLEYTYYRSARPGHILAGVHSMTAPQTVSTPTDSSSVR